MSSFNNQPPRGGAHPPPRDTEEEERRKYQDKLEDFRQRREQRKQLDVVTVGEGNKPKKPDAVAEKAKESDALPLYRFQRRELFDHDVPNIRQPTVRSVRTLIKNRQPVAKKVVPLDTTSFKPSSAPTGDQTQGGMSGMQLMAQDDTDALVSINGRSRNKEMDPDEALAHSLQQVVRARKAAIQQNRSANNNGTLTTTVNNTTANPSGTMMTTTSNAPLAVSVAPNDDLDIVNLHTADDTVSYFSTHGSQTAVKYVYLNPVRNSLDFRPYDLQVVLRGQQQPEHYVISSTGVVHVKPSHPSEVIALSNWMRESAMFTVLRKIRLFRTYLVHKAFNYWRKNVQLRMYLETRRRLCKKLFISKATFAGATMELVKGSYDLTSTKLLAYDAVGKQDYTIEEFTTLQAQQRSKAAVELTGNVEKMETRLSKLTDAIQQRANVPDLASMESLEQYLLANAVATGNDKRGGGRKAKSMVAAKREQYDRMCELKSSMVEYSMLDSFIRLVDYIASETIFKNALLTVLKLYRVIHDQVDKEVKTLGFQILVHPTDDGMTFRPSQTDLEKVYAESVEDIVQTVNGISRLLNQKPLKVYFAKTPKLWNIGAEFKRDARVISAQHNTKLLIRQDYELADAKMKLYAGCRQWLTFIDHEWPQIHEEWAANKENLTSDDITRMYEQLDHANSSFRVLLATFVGHLLYINAARLKAELEPKIRAIKEAVDQTLTEVTRARTKKLQSYFTKKRALLTPPTNVKRVDLHRFVEFVANLKAANEVKTEIETEGFETDSLYSLMERQGVDMNDEDKQLRELTLGAPTQQSAIKPLRDLFFLETMEAAETFKEGNIDQAVRELADAVKAVHDRVETYEREINGDDYVQCITPTDQILDQLERVESQLQHAHTERDDLNRCAGLLQHPVEWGPLDACQSVFDARHDVWTLQDTYDNKVHSWFTTPLVTLDVQEMEQQVKEMFQKAFKLQQHIQSKGMQDHVSERVLDALKEMRENMPIILDCGNPNMTAEHWNRVFSQIRADDNGVFQYNEGLNLQTLRERDVWSWKEVVAEQSGIATGEANLAKALDEIRTIWEGIDFDTKKYKGDRNIYILQSLDEIVQQLDDHHVQLQTLMASRFVAGVKGRVEEWSIKLRTVSDVLEEWVTLQKNWMYLEFIFSSDDIKRQLPDESERFDIVDGLFKDIMGKANTVKNVLQICTEDDLLTQLQENNKAIDEIQKKLEEYLETKRVAFPRFYFLSNDELLSILSDVRNPKAVQPHLTKCFDSIAALIFNNEAATEIGGMQSGEGEEVSFERVVHPVGNVEQWLGQIERMMKSSLLMHMRETVEAYPQSVREEWFFQYPAQCVQATDMIVWTGEVENAIASQQLPDYHHDYHEQIINTVELVKTPLTKLQRTLVGTLIVVDVHNRDVVQRLIDANVEQLSDFEWVQQLKYYWEHDHNINSLNVGIHHSSAHLWYGYEYLGNQPRLVITPLTDRAFLTCTSALAMNLGAAPQGPAGTGKTESVKDLGKALARQVVVFNCSDGINYKTMSRMFAGLAQAGAWACFDEFNRIELEVLSVIAQQMLEIVMALGHNLENMDFDGHPIKLSRNFGVFITMNPGYAGRTELPDNLKALFRPICMMIPDYALIAEIMFFSEGFSDARSLAQKMVRLYSLASQQLSKQDHYDFGMRAVKSILVMAGALKRADPDDPEDMILIRAMRDSNVPKFLRDDTKLFLALINDLFPAVEIREVPNPDLQRSVTASLTKNGLQVVQPFVQKVLQLYETMVVRHGVMLVGQTMTGKTTNSDTLANALSQLYNDNIEAIQESHKRFFHTTHVVRLNPKAISMGEMYGDVNRMTREWQDGVLSSIVRELVRNTTPDRHWVTFDGPVDAIWIENMNTVLDDNKLLCLVNGERIKVPDTISILFEVQDLRVASPATVSRCGMVFMEPYYLDGGWAPIARSRSEKISAELKNTTIEPTSVVPPPTAAQRRTSTKRASIVASAAGGDGASPPPFRPKGFVRWQHDRLMTHLNNFLPDTLEHLRTHCAEYIPTCDAQLALNLVEMVYSMVLTFLNDDDGDDLATKAGKPLPSSRSEPLDQQKAFDMMFLQSYVWCVGGNTNDRTRASFATFVRGKVRDVLPLMAFPCNGDETVFDFFMHKRSLTWQLWSFKVPQFQYNPDAPYFDLLVPTADTVILSAMLESACHINKHALINGVTGTGKSSAVSNFVVSTLHSEDQASSYAAFSITFSAQTSSHNLQETIESKLIRRRGDKVIGPQPGKKMIGIIDDCNMPQLEVYGASPPIELLRQMITQGGFYDRKKLLFKEVMDVIVVACCGEPGGGKNELSMRLTSQFLVLCVTALSTLSMKQIFNGILGGFLNSHKFPTNIIELTESTVDATLAIYTRIAAEMLPTPEKTHYTFNLRDISKVVQGILQCTSEHCLTPVHFVRLWAHESSRVFHDRLINVHDRTWWRSCVDSVIQQHFPETHSSNPSDVSMGEHGSLGSALFGSWADKKSNEYKEILDQKMLHDMLKEYQVGYNTSEMKDVDLVLFDDAVCHLARLCRILRQPRGNALLVGVGGSGRHSLCELAAYICTMECKGIVIVRNYGITEFRDDVKKILLECGAKNKSVVFLLSDNQLIDTQMLEDVNNLLNIGEVPGLMAPEDYDIIMNGCREGVRAAGKPETRNSIYQYFVSRCRDALHVILCMSPIGAPFRDRLRMFPSLVNCMTIDWYTAWPEDALLSVAKRIVARVDLGGGASSSEQLKERICQMAVYMHLTVADANDEMFKELRRRNSTTPTSYLSLLSLYLDMYANRLKEINGDISRYQNGVDKLQSTNNTIEVLKKKIRDMQPVLAKAAEEADAQNAQLVVDQAAADVIKSEVSKEEEIARSLMDEAEGIKQECADGLEEAIPALRNAEEALKTLSAKDIQEIKVFASPPANVAKTLDAVLTLLGKKEGWASAKLELGNLKFLQILAQYDRDSISAGVIRKLKKFIDDPEYVPDVIEKTSVPCKSLCLWTHAMYKYYHVAKDIAPKRERLAMAQAKVEAARAELDIKQANLSEVVKKLAELERAAKDTADRKAGLEGQITQAEAKLGRADQLIHGLGAENSRWQANLVDLKEKKGTVVGTMCLASGAVAYLGPFVSSYRSTLLQNWTAKCKELAIPVEEGFSMEALVGQFKIREWTLQGLPLDPFSIENGAILHWSKRWCLMIDPQGQANHYIRKKEAANKLKVIKLADDNYMRTLESAIQVGSPVLLENVGEELDAALDPVLLRQAIKQGGRMVLKLGEKEVEYDPNFRLYITTKLPNPTFTPELQIKVNVINFTVTRKGLEDQSLSDVVAFERSDLQERSDQCVVAIAKGKGEIKGLEDTTLRMLAESTGDILDNIELINTLSASKRTAETIANDLIVVETTNAEIDVARERYRILATRGSLIYSVIASLSNIDPMYQYSLQFYKKLFVTTLEKNQVGLIEDGEADEADLSPEEQNERFELVDARRKDPEVTVRRIAALIPAVSLTSYNVVCRGLFEKDKLLFSFMLTVTFQQHAEKFSDAEWDLFLRGGAGTKIPAEFPERPEWIGAPQWLDVAALSQRLPVFKGLGRNLAIKEAWKEWALSDTVSEVPPPSPCEDCTEWERAILVKAIRPERLVSVMRRVVDAYLAKEYTVSPQFSLREAFTDSSHMTPLIFVLSTGTDPTALFTAFADEMGFGERKLMLSLGQDQGKRAAQMIEEGRKDGLWVYLQNCHVYVSWMPALERIVEAMHPQDTHPDFRLWLTSSPSPAFPVPVLQSGLKLTREPPKGLKANLKDFAHSLDPSVWDEHFPHEATKGPKGTIIDRGDVPLDAFMEGGRNKNREWKRLVFSLAFFHGLLQERRKFGAVGWNIAYEWSAPDFSASLKTLRIAINDFEELPWTAIKYTVGVINYGGRVTDFLDQRCLKTICGQFFSEGVMKGADLQMDKEGTYVAPSELSTIEDLLGCIERYPDQESPEVFGLHANADISFQSKEASLLTKTLISLAPRGGGSGGSSSQTPDQQVLDIADDLLKRLPAQIDTSEAHPTSFALDANGNMISLGTVLSQEIDQFNRLLRVTSGTLKELKRAIKGEVVMSSTMESMFNAFLFNLVPDNWKKAGYLCLKPLSSYFLDLIARINFINGWCVNGAPGSFWLSGFFFPQGFVTGVFQTHSRKHGIPIDCIKFRFHAQPHTDDPSSLGDKITSGVCCHGFFLEGAAWREGQLRESSPGTLHVPLPPLHFEPALVTEPEVPGMYECPLYKTSTRAGILSTTGLSTNFVINLQLPTPQSVPASHWVDRGVAALCMLDH